MDDFKINKFITLRLEKGKTVIYIKDEKFLQCKYLLIEIPNKNLEEFDDLESIDDVSEKLDRSLENDLKKHHLDPKTEFWGHCSNLQAWVENNYDTRLLHSNLAFPLLKRLTEVGDPTVRKVFKEEIIKRLEKGNVTTVLFLIERGFLNYFSKEEFATLLLESQNNNNNTKNIKLLINLREKIVDPTIDTNGLMYLIRRYRIFEIIAKHGDKYIESKFANWLYESLEKVQKKAPSFIMAEKLIENLAILNQYSECPNCKKEIKKNHTICEKCGQELENILTYEENLDYIRDYLHDKMYTQTEIIHELGQEVETLKEIVKNLKLKSGYEKCQKCNGTGIIIVDSALNMKYKCSKCNGEGVIETNRSIMI